MPKDPTLQTRDEWSPLPAAAAREQARGNPSSAQIKRWELLLNALQIEYRVERGWFGSRLLVRSDDFERAVEQIRIYESENRDWPPTPPAPPAGKGSPLITLSVIFLVASFHNLTQTHQPLPLLGAPDWYEQGTLYAGKFRDGELWRGLTALTLHGDLPHVLGNGVVAFIFIEQLRKRYGSGCAWLLFLASGFCGNAVNALLQPYHHQAVGASTAVFGLLGVIAADSLIRYRLQLMRRWLMPLAAAFALLGFLGTSGENTDLGAHLWGFFCGGMLGVVVAVRWRHVLPPADQFNRILSLLSILTICVAWLSSFRAT